MGFGIVTCFVKCLVKSLVIFAIFALAILFIPDLPPHGAEFTPYELAPTRKLTGPLAINSKLDNAERIFEHMLKGPESLAQHNGVLYTGIHGGHVVRLVGNSTVEPVFKFGKQCEGLHEEHICGRPLGLHFDSNGYLYVADAYYGIYKADVATGAAQRLIDPDTEVEGRKPKFINSVVVSSDGKIYWSDSDSNFDLKSLTYSMLTDGTGRLIKYDPVTKRNTVLIDRIFFANGVALAEDESYVLVVETVKYRILRYYLKGPKKGSHDVFIDGLPGMPDNLKSDGSGNVYAGLVLIKDAEKAPEFVTNIGKYPSLRKFVTRSLTLLQNTFIYLDSIFPHDILDKIIHGIAHGETLAAVLPKVKHVIIVKLDKNGDIVDSLHSTDGRIIAICEIELFNGFAYLASPFNHYLARVKLPDEYFTTRDTITSKDSKVEKEYSQLCIHLMNKCSYQYEVSQGKHEARRKLRNHRNTGKAGPSYKVFPKKNPEAGTKIIVWKRYSEFKNLHKELKKRHSSFHIGEAFPVLAKPHFFDRFSDAVIKERKIFILSLLNFVAKYPPLFTADVFVKFFQNGYSISDYDKLKDSCDKSDDIDYLNNALLRFDDMGQVLQTDGSLSSEESQCSVISNIKQTKISKHADEDTKTLNKTRKQEAESCSIVNRSSFIENVSYADMPEYWEEAVAHADEAHQQEVLGNYEVAFTIYKTAIVCLLSGVQGDNNSEHRVRVKERTSQYLLQAEWIYNNHLVHQLKPPTPKVSRIPWRSRLQLRRYKVIRIVGNNLLVHDTTDNVFVIIKGVLKSNYPLDRTETCVLPREIPYVVKLLALHETDSTIFFILEHIRHGKLWDHLEHYFASYPVENLDTEVTCSPVKEEDGRSVASSNGSTNERSLSRLESSACTDTMSCESLSSHDENYFDLVEDYARAKSQKLKEIQMFNERRKQVESLRPVKKTVSQVDLKAMDEEEEPPDHCRSHSLTDLVHDENGIGDGLRTRLYDMGESKDSEELYSLSDNEDEQDNDFSSSIDIDTQRLLRNAQRLIESINETLSKNENQMKSAQMEEPANPNTNNTLESYGVIEEEISENDVDDDGLKEVYSQNKEIDIEDEITKQQSIENISESKLKELNICSPVSESIPSITEEYSVTGMLQRNGITPDLVKKWAMQLLSALDVLHQNGIICRDLNPNNILLSDDGSIKLTYFFRYPNVDPTLNFNAKKRLYVAPEVINPFTNISFASDWWSYGAILYELITLQSLYNSHPGGISSYTMIQFPDKMASDARSLLSQLLKYDPMDRLGSGISGADDIRSHPFFIGSNWEEVL